MKTISINGAPRKTTGTHNARHLRKEGNVPCVLYGGKEQLFFFAHENQFSKLLYTPDAYFVTINIEGKKVDAIVQDAQFDKVSDKIAHVDFIEAVPGKALTIKIPVITEGSPVGVKKGGKLQVKIRRLKVMGLPQDIPDHITLKVENLDLGETIQVKDVKIDKLKILDPENSAILTVRMTREIEIPTGPTPAITTVVATAPGAAPGAAPPATGGAAETKKEEKPAAAKK
jgi:large subunit ribosomal protein L25